MKHVVLVVLSFFMAGTVFASAQSIGGSLQEDVAELEIYLNKLTVSEANFRVHTKDQAAILWTLYRRYKYFKAYVDSDVTLLEVAKKYSRKLGSNRKRYRWIRNLTPGTAVPRNFNSNANWQSVVDEWSLIQKRTKMWLAGDLQDPCVHYTQHWGAPGFRESHMKSKGFRRVWCGRTSNWFWGR